MNESKRTQRLIAAMNESEVVCRFRKAHGDVYLVNVPDIIGHVCGIYTELEVKVHYTDKTAPRLRAGQFNEMNRAFLRGAVVGLGIYVEALKQWRVQICIPPNTIVLQSTIKESFVLLFNSVCCRATCTFCGINDLPVEGSGVVPTDADSKCF